MNDKKQTLSQWAFDQQIRLLDEKFYKDETLYTIEEYTKIVPRDIEVPLTEGKGWDVVNIIGGDIVVNHEVLNQIKQFQKIKLEMDLKEKELKEKLKGAMKEVGLKQFSIDGLYADITMVKGRATIDTKRLKEELPDIAEEYTKIGEPTERFTFKIVE